MEVSDWTKIMSGYTAFRQKLAYPYNQNAWRKFANYVGLDPSRAFRNQNMTDEIRARIDMIKGPHGETLYKAWVAKNDKRKKTNRT